MKGAQQQTNVEFYIGVKDTCLDKFIRPRQEHGSISLQQLCYSSQNTNNHSQSPSIFELNSLCGKCIGLYLQMLHNLIRMLLNFNLII